MRAGGPPGLPPVHIYRAHGDGTVLSVLASHELQVEAMGKRLNTGAVIALRTWTVVSKSRRLDEQAPSVIPGGWPAAMTLCAKSGSQPARRRRTAARA